MSEAERHRLVLDLDRTVQESEKMLMLKVDDEVLASAKAYLRSHQTVIPTLTDWTCVLLMVQNNAKDILSYDTDFDNVRRIPAFSEVRRVDI